MSAAADLIVVSAMEKKLPLTFVSAIFATILLSLGCQKKTAATHPNTQSKSELRDSTKPLQAADLVGYNGTKLRDSMDRIKEANAKHSREMEKMTDIGPDQ